MNSKKNLLIAILTTLVLATLIYAAPRLQVYVERISRNDGDTRTMFNVAVTSTSWATILSANTIRRYVIMKTTSTSVDLICLSTFTTSGIVCNPATATTKIYTLANGLTFEEYSEGALYGRLLNGSALTHNVVGIEYSDSKDSTTAP